MIQANSWFPLYTTSTKYATMQITFCSFFQMNNPLSDVDGVASNLVSSPFSFKYQNLLACARLYMHFCNFYNWLVLKLLLKFIRLECVPLSYPLKMFSWHQRIYCPFFWRNYWTSETKTFSLKHAGLSVLKFCSSSKPLPHNCALISFSLSTDFSSTTHHREVHTYPRSGASLQTFLSFQRWSSFSEASNVFFLFLTEFVFHPSGVID